jgi:phage terminase small subunit
MPGGGSKPKPTALKLIQGNPGKRPLNKQEPIPAGEIICPPWVTGYAKEVWDHIGPDLIEQRVMTAWDVYAFGMYCYLVAQMKEDPEHFVKSNTKMSALRQFGSALGIGDARARAQIHAGEKKNENPEENYFGT